MVVTDFTTNPDYVVDCIISTKKLGPINSISNFCHEITWDGKRWWSSYKNAPFFARAYHLKCEYHDAPKFGDLWVGFTVQCRAAKIS